MLRSSYGASHSRIIVKIHHGDKGCSRFSLISSLPSPEFDLPAVLLRIAVCRRENLHTYVLPGRSFTILAGETFRCDLLSHAVSTRDLIQIQSRRIPDSSVLPATTVALLADCRIKSAGTPRIPTACFWTCTGAKQISQATCVRSAESPLSAKGRFFWSTVCHYC